MPPCAWEVDPSRNSFFVMTATLPSSDSRIARLRPAMPLPMIRKSASISGDDDIVDQPCFTDPEGGGQKRRPADFPHRQQRLPIHDGDAPDPPFRHLPDS